LAPTRARLLSPEDAVDEAVGDGSGNLRRPRLLLVNLGLTLALLVALVAGVLPLPVLFMIAYAVALMINFPTLDQQKSRLDAHAGNALAVASVICAAGILTVIMSGTKMIDAMGHSVLLLVPPFLCPQNAISMGITS